MIDSKPASFQMLEPMKIGPEIIGNGQKVDFLEAELCEQDIDDPLDGTGS
jgi:hypothetical protein